MNDKGMEGSYGEYRGGLIKGEMGIKEVCLLVGAMLGNVEMEDYLRGLY